MSAGRARTKGALPITGHGGLEIVNGIGLAAFRGAISAEAWRDVLTSFDEDLAERRYVHADILWRATLRRAGEISRRHAPCRHGAGAWPSVLRHVRSTPRAACQGHRVEAVDALKVTAEVRDARARRDVRWLGA